MALSGRRAYRFGKGKPSPGAACACAQGRLTLAFFSGVSLTVEGPADLELLAADRVFFHHGKLRVRVMPGAEGFTVLTAGYEVVDLGTEFALNREPGGKSRVMVFEGEAAVSVLGKDGRSIRGALVERQRSVEIDPDGGGIREVTPEPEAFVPLGEFVPAPLELAPELRRRGPRRRAVGPLALRVAGGRRASPTRSRGVPPSRCWAASPWSARPVAVGRASVWTTLLRPY